MEHHMYINIIYKTYINKVKILVFHEKYTKKCTNERQTREKLNEVSNMHRIIVWVC